MTCLVEGHMTQSQQQQQDQEVVEDDARTAGTGGGTRNGTGGVQKGDLDLVGMEDTENKKADGETGEQNEILRMDTVGTMDPSLERGVGQLLAFLEHVLVPTRGRCCRPTRRTRHRRSQRWWCSFGGEEQKKEEGASSG